MENKFVSIIMPVFNGENYLAHSIHSVLRQTHQNLELIIIDDGSTDSTPQIIKSFTDKRIKNYRQTNSGPSSARNKGIEMATGAFIAMIDADDTYHPDKLAEQISCIEKTETDTCYCDYQLIDEHSKKGAIIKSEKSYTNRHDFLAMLLFRQILHPPTIMFKRLCFDKGLKYDESYRQSEDYKLTIELAQRHNISHLPKVLYQYRRHDKNLSNDQQKHEMNEKRIIKDLGEKKIELIVNQSNLTSNEKTFLKARVYYKIGEYEKSAAALRLISPATAGSLFYSGNINYLNNKFEPAIQLFTEAIKINSHRAETFNNLGCCFAMLCRNEEAMKCFGQAITLKKNYNDPRSNLEELKKHSMNYKLTFRELRSELTSYQQQMKQH